MKTLLVIGHPDLQHSQINRQWVEAITPYTGEELILHDLSKAVSSDGSFDIEREHALLSSVDRVVLQFPLYWYMPPAILVGWMTQVWCDGWAYGIGGTCMEHLKLEVVCSCGAPEIAFRATSLEQYMNYFRGSAAFVRCQMGGIYAFYGAESEEVMERLSASIPEYIDFVLGKQTTPPTE